MEKPIRREPEAGAVCPTLATFAYPKQSKATQFICCDVCQSVSMSGGFHLNAMSAAPGEIYRNSLGGNLGHHRSTMLG
jgi:hypothetical protein